MIKGQSPVSFRLNTVRSGNIYLLLKNFDKNFSQINYLLNWLTLWIRRYVKISYFYYKKYQYSFFFEIFNVKIYQKNQTFYIYFFICFFLLPEYIYKLPPFHYKSKGHWFNKYRKQFWKTYPYFRSKRYSIMKDLEYYNFFTGLKYVSYLLEEMLLKYCNFSNIKIRFFNIYSNSLLIKWFRFFFLFKRKFIYKSRFRSLYKKIFFNFLYFLNLALYYKNVELFGKVLCYYFKKTRKIHLFVYTLRQFLEFIFPYLSNITYIRIDIRGKLTREGGKGLTSIEIGQSSSLQSLLVNYEYYATTVKTSKGVYGIKVYLV